MKYITLLLIYLSYSFYSCSNPISNKQAEIHQQILKTASDALELRKANRIDLLMNTLISAENAHIEDSQIAIIMHQVAIYWYLKADAASYQKALDFFKKALDIRQKTLQPNDPIFAKNYLNIGKCQKYLFLYYQAVNSFDKALKSYQIQMDTISVMEVYCEIGDTYDEIGDYQAAINYFKEALNFHQPTDTKEQETYTMQLAKVYHLVGISNINAHNLPQAALYFQKALLLFETLKDTVKMSRCFHELGMIKCQEGIFLQAFNYFNQSVNYNTDEIEKTETSIEIAKTYLKQKKYLEAQKWANQAVLTRKELNNNKNVECLQVLGQIAEAQQNPDSALIFYQKALQIIDTTFTNNDVLINPIIDAKTCNRKIELINLLANKADPLSILYKKTKNKAYLIAALNTYQLADNLVQTLRREMQDDQSKYFWNGTALPIYKKGIDVAYQLFELEQNPPNKLDYKLVLLQLSERTKAPVLREGIADNQAKSFAGVPATERQRERELRATIAILERQTTSDAKIMELLMKTRTQLYAFQDSLKTKHPTYARYLAATADDTPLSINDLKRVQKQLSDTTLVIEYAFGSHDLYEIAVSNTDFNIFKTPLTPDFYAQIDSFNYAVNDYDAIKKDFNATGRAYAATSFDLYQRLLEQPLMRTGHKSTVIYDSLMPSVFKRIHLILDNQLHLFPFKALTDKPVKGWIGDFPEHFLVKQYAFSSLFSIQTLLKSTPSVSRVDTAHFKLACFGLDFKDTTLWRQKTAKTSLKTKKNNVLERAESEITGIANQFKGRPYFNKEATKDSFLKNAPQYDFLHITTHGYPEGLVFQKANATDSLHEVSIGDIYGLLLHTRFTFLSACETGQGKLSEAEGVMSLGRAFSYAGSQSVIMSLWSIPDGSTSKIAQAFYTYYHQGLPKDIAEQRAEIDFLNTATDKQSLPNHWAALTIIGDMSPLDQTQTPTNWWAWGLLAGLVLFWLFFVFKSKKQYTF